MNITTRAQFEELLKDLDTQLLVAIDTETSGLSPYGKWDSAPTPLISLSFYFPENKHSYNAAFRHGEGVVEVSWNKKEPRPFEELTWQGKAKGQIYIGTWFEEFKKATDPSYFENLPIEWLEELKSHWKTEGQNKIFHNFRFDGHVLKAEGFPDCDKITDTMILLHLVNEDFRGMEVNAPFKYTNADVKRGSCGLESVGRWARNPDGTLMLKSQQGNRQLKWQAALHGFEGATEGEDSLYAAIKEFEETLADFACKFPEHTYNAFAMTKKTGLSRSKIADKISLDSKANMWMLPSSDVSYYAELDTKLTWDLYEWCNKVIANWGNQDLADNLNDIQLHVAWKMEVHGFKLDREQALKEVEKLTPRIAEVTEILTKVAGSYGFAGGDLALDSEEDEDEAFNPSSNPKLGKFLRSGVLGVDFGKTLFPDWVDEELTRELAVYPEAKIYKTDKENLDPFDKHPIIKLVKMLRIMKKSRDTYLSRWLKACDPNGIVRFSMNADGTVSGRFSSSGDAGNGQNIPDRTYTIKTAIIPYSDEWVFFAVDYGQLELRLACDYAERRLGFDPNMTMTKLFLSGEDMHAYVRDDVGVKAVLFPGLTDEQIIVKIGLTMQHKDVIADGAAAKIDAYCRQVAKTLNFGLLYSGTEFMLNKLLKCGLEPAKVLVQRWKRLFPAFSLAQDYYTDLALTRRDLPVASAGLGMYAQQFHSGRFRKLHKYPNSKWYENEYGSQSWFNPQAAAAKKVWNAMVQGDGGYICTASALKYVQTYGTDNLKMFANIHDALDGFVRRGHEEEIVNLARIMCDWDVIPNLTVDLQRSIDGTWQGIKPIAKGYVFDRNSTGQEPEFLKGMEKWKSS